MEIHEKILITLLSHAIREEAPAIHPHDNFSWESLYQEAEAHHVHTLLYPLVANAKTASIPEPLLTKWKINTQSAAARQLQHIEQLSTIIEAFQEEHIPVIALKGLILRNYYPHPELRTMGDGDLLIHKEDMKRVKKLLRQRGYRLKESTPRHFSFSHKYFPILEIHQYLSEKEAQKTFPTLTSNAFKRTLTEEIPGTGIKVLTLSTEDQLIHLLLHFAGHLMLEGIGLRGVCDIVLFLEAKGWNLDMGYVQDKALSCGLSHMGATLLRLCEKYFSLKLPCIFSAGVDDSSVDLLMEDILKAGVYGRKTMERDISGSLLKYHTFGKDKKHINCLRYKIQFYFPNSKSLHYRYRYAKRLPLLLPVAWLHRGVHNCIRLKSLRFYKDAAVLSKERALLLTHLKLR